MASDDKEFEQIYRSLSPGMVIVACSAKSLLTLRSFCLSLKGAALRCGSDAILLSSGSARINWEELGAQIVEPGKRGIRVFVINRFEDTSMVSLMSLDPGFDKLDGSIEQNLAQMLHEAARGNNLTILLTTVAQRESQIQERRIATIRGREKWVFIALLHDRVDDDWYSATVTTAATEDNQATEKTYWHLDFVPFGTELISTQPSPEARPQPEPVSDSDKPTVNGPEKGRASWLRRLFS